MGIKYYHRQKEVYVSIHTFHSPQHRSRNSSKRSTENKSYLFLTAKKKCDRLLFDEFMVFYTRVFLACVRSGDRLLFF